MSQNILSQDNEQLLNDVRQVLSSTEDLIKGSGDEGGEKARELRQRISQNLTQAKGKILEVQQTVTCHAKAAAKATDQYVQENPWKAIGIATGVGLLLGMLISRR